MVIKNYKYLFFKDKVLILFVSFEKKQSTRSQFVESAIAPKCMLCPLCELKPKFKNKYVQKETE